MAKAAQKPKPKGAKPTSAVKPTGKKPSGSWTKLLVATSVPKKTKPKPVKPKPVKKGPAVAPPLTDEQVGPIPGLPSEEDIEQRVGALSTADKAAFTKIRRLLAEKLGSYAAARAWLTAPGRGFDGTPLDAIRDGMAKRVLELVQAQSSRNPPYA